MKNCLLLVSIIFAYGSSHAATVYVTDDLKLTLRSGPSPKNKIVAMLSSGTPLSVLKKSSKGYLKVKTPKGSTGFILSHHTQKDQTSQWHLNKANEALANLRKQNQQLDSELKTLKNESRNTTSDKDALVQEKDQLDFQYKELQQTAANAIQLKSQRDQLQKRVVITERELQQLKREKQNLEESNNLSWFMYGGMLAFAGIFLGLLIPKISWQKRASNWDTF